MFVQFASFVSHHQENRISNFHTTLLCFKWSYHKAEFSSENFFHHLELKRERTQISNILLLIDAYGSLYIYHFHSSLQKQSGEASGEITG